MSSCSFLTDLFHPGCWPMRFLQPASSEASIDLLLDLSLTSHPPGCIPWFPLLYFCVICRILSTLRDCNWMTSWDGIIVVEFSVSGFILIGLYIPGVTFLGFWSCEFSTLFLFPTPFFFFQVFLMPFFVRLNKWNIFCTWTNENIYSTKMIY